MTGKRWFFDSNVLVYFDIRSSDFTTKSKKDTKESNKFFVSFASFVVATIFRREGP